MKKVIALMLVLILSMSFAQAASAYDNDTLKQAVQSAAAAVKADDPTLGSEWFLVADSTWQICGLDDSYRKAYYDNIVELLKANDGGLGVSRFTEYERVIIALTALGYDARDIEGYDIISRLADYDVVKKQGVNSIIFALIALDSGLYDMPTDPNAANPNSREKMVDNILNREIEGGGFALRGDVADVDITAMAIQALSKYTEREDVKTAIDRAVAELSRQQLSNGSFASLSGKSDEGTAESTAQVILALTTVGISVDDARFTKDTSVMDALLSFQLPDGSFKHLESDTEGDYAATVQSMHAICAAVRAKEQGKAA
ncbi:MAG: terpene cyclase/mutase family protein, partial [Oscillospiraceae bacterium]|nr:terpene cyclase/mutase family protein [Oscillospiraceae bacterium]